MPHAHLRARLLPLPLLAALLVGCPGDDNNDPVKNNTTPDMTTSDMTTPDMGEDMNEDMGVDMRGDMSSETPACVVLRTEPVALSLDAAHDVSVLVECAQELDAACASGGCATLGRGEVEAQAKLTDAGIQRVEGAEGAFTYAVTFKQLQSPPADADDRGAVAALGLEPMTLQLPGGREALDVSVRWRMSDAALTALNEPDPYRRRLPKALRTGGRLAGVRVINQTEAYINPDKPAPLVGVTITAGKVELVQSTGGAVAGVLHTLTTDTSALTDPFFDVFPTGDDTYVVYWSAHDTKTGALVGMGGTLTVTTEANGQVTVTPDMYQTYTVGAAGVIDGMYRNAAVSIGDKEVILNIGFKTGGELVMVRTSRDPKARDRRPAVKTLAIRARNDANADTEKASDYEQVGVLSPGDPKAQAGPVLWFARKTDTGAELVLRGAVISDPGGTKEELRMTETLGTFPLVVNDLTTLQIERLAGPDGQAVGFVANSDAGVFMLRRDAQGAWTDAATLPVPPNIRLGVGEATGARGVGGASFRLDGNHLVAFGRWPWSWRDRLKSRAAQDAPTFVVRWDLNDKKLLGARLAGGGRVKRSSTSFTLDALRTSDAVALGGSGTLRPTSVEGPETCDETGTCHLLAGLPSGEQLYLKGGPNGAVLATGKYGDILIDGVPLEFDLTRPTGPRPLLAGAPAMMTRPGGGAYLLLPVWKDGADTPENIIWLMNPDGTITKTAATFQADMGAGTQQEFKGTPDAFNSMTVATTAPDGEGGQSTTIHIISPVAFENVALKPDEPLVLKPASGAFTYDDPRDRISTAQGRPAHAPILFSSSRSMTAPHGLLPPSDMREAVELPDRDVPLLFGHRGTGCGAITLSAVEGLDGGTPEPRVLLERASTDPECADAEVIIGAGRFFNADMFAVATYRPTTREVWLTYLVEDRDGGLFLEQRVLGKLEQDPGDIPTARLANTSGSGLSDITFSSGGWDDDIFLMKNHGDGTSTITISATLEVTYQTAFQATTNTQPPQNKPAGGAPPSYQFSSMSSFGASTTPVSAGAFTKVEAGGSHTCALRASGIVTCWGLGDEGETTPPAGTYQDVSTGENFTCGVKTSGELVCWGRPNEGATMTPPGVFKKVSAGQTTACAIRANDTLACWGNNGLTPTPPAGAFKDVNVGNGNICGIRADDSLVCWTVFDNTETNHMGTYASVSLGPSDRRCTITTAGVASCTSGAGGGAPSAASFKQITSGFAHGCGIKADDTLECWGNNMYMQATPPPGTFTQVHTSRFHTCATATDGSVTCWGNNPVGETDVPTGQWLEVVPGRTFACGRRADHTVTCWGSLPQQVPLSASATFSSFDAGAAAACGVQSDATLACWGSGVHNQTTHPAGTFTEVGTGYRYSCAIKTDQTVDCWGDYIHGAGTIRPVPTGTFQSLTPGLYTPCGVDTSGAIQCWGRYTGMESNMPAGAWVSASAGLVHMCGLRASGSVECWGHTYGSHYEPAAQTPPAGTFTQITSGYRFSCGLKADGSIACWGNNQYGALNTPSGSFISIHAFEHDVCATRANGTAVCWGRGGYGIANIPS